MTIDIPIVVVGAGPAGTAAAWCLARRGLKRVTLLEQNRWPRPKPCAGGLGPRAIAWLNREGLLDEVGRKAVTIDSLHFTGPSGRSAVLSVPGTTALVLPRISFDALLVDHAVRQGVSFLPETRVMSVENGPHGAAVLTSAGVFEAAAVVVAAGGPCHVNVDLPARNRALGILLRYTNLPHTPRQMKMIFSRQLSPYYAWLFPEPKGVVNIGLMVDSQTVRGNLHTLFDSILQRHFAPQISSASPVGRRRAGQIRFRDTIGRMVDGQVLVVGEAAGLVNSATGEGIPYGLESGQHAANVIFEAIEHNRINIRALGRYQCLMRWRYTARLRAAQAFRRFASSSVFAIAADVGTQPFAQSLFTRLLSNV